METQFFMKLYTEAHKIVMDYSLMSSSIKLYKDSSFLLKLKKIILSFENQSFSMYFVFFHSYAPQSLQRRVNTE